MAYVNLNCNCEEESLKILEKIMKTALMNQNVQPLL